jgi:hypothetical protein
MDQANNASCSSRLESSDYHSLAEEIDSIDVQEIVFEFLLSKGYMDVANVFADESGVHPHSIKDATGSKVLSDSLSLLEARKYEALLGVVENLVFMGDGDSISPKIHNVLVSAKFDIHGLILLRMMEHTDYIEATIEYARGTLWTLIDEAPSCISPRLKETLESVLSLLLIDERSSAIQKMHTDISTHLRQQLEELVRIRYNLTADTRLEFLLKNLAYSEEHFKPAGRVAKNFLTVESVPSNYNNGSFSAASSRSSTSDVIMSPPDFYEL